MTERDSEDDPESYGDYSVDDEDQPSNIDALPDPDVADELDRGYSPPEHWSAGQRYGNTPYEEATGESLDQRIAQETPSRTRTPRPTGGRPRRVDGPRRRRGGRPARRPAGRPRPGLGEDTESDLVGEDVGIDGAAASAEEAAVHVVPEPGDR